MSWTGESNAVDHLLDQWTRWTTLVELFVKRRRARLRVKPEVYEAAHTEVVESCHLLASMVEDEEKQFFHDLERLASPWTSIKSFRVPEREILVDLLRQCRKVERQLGRRHLTLPNLRGPTRLILMATAMAAFMLVFWTAGQAWAPFLQSGRTWKEAYIMCVARTRYVHHILFPGMVVVTVSSFLVWRTQKG
jgi:hypothetical protein